MNKQILQELEKEGVVYSARLAELFDEPHQKVVGAIKSIESIGNVIEVEQVNKKVWTLTEDGEATCKVGSLEAQLFALIPSEGKSIESIKSEFEKSQIALGYALRQKWILKEKDLVLRNVETIQDLTQENLRELKAGKIIDDSKLSEYKKRQLITQIPQTVFVVRKGPNFSTSVTKYEAELTKDMIESGQWRTSTFKPFNFKSRGKLEQRAGYLHPLMQLREEFRKVFLEMGFTEMPTNNYVESAFWNFDALFQPQKHPARDAQDTFYVSNPERTLSLPMDYVEKVKEVHTVGGYGSIGYQSPWCLEEAHKNLLRTHTTAVSARLLHKLAQDGFKPTKFFSIDKVYRNETLDATHLAEFHQVEGVMADTNLSMKHLMGTFTAFFEKIGIPDIRFKPTYNPYTEPSMEIYSYHKGLGKWVEVGNSGYFRPEMLRTMGLPENATVAGWGLSLERPAMIMYGINNIRELVGSRVKMELIHENPVCTIDKFQRKSRPKPNTSQLHDLQQRQDQVLGKLQDLKNTATDLTLSMKLENESSSSTDLGNNGLPLDLVIYCDPARPPFSVRGLTAILSSTINLKLHVHVHSTVKNLNKELLHFWDPLQVAIQNTTTPKATVRIVWRLQSKALPPLSPSLSVSHLAQVQVTGEANICRYLSRVIEYHCTSRHIYERLSNSKTAEIDYYLDCCSTVLAAPNNREKAVFLNLINKTLKKSELICGADLSVADFMVLSIVRQFDLKAPSPEFQKWLDACRAEHSHTKYVL